MECSVNEQSNEIALIALITSNQHDVSSRHSSRSIIRHYFCVDENRSVKTGNKSTVRKRQNRAQRPAIRHIFATFVRSKI